MRLLLTRPAADAMAVAEQLAEQGHDVLLSPMIDITLAAQASLPAQHEQAAVAFTSANGVRALMAQLHGARASQTQIADWFQLPVFAVGPQTAAAAHAAGFATIHQASGDVAALAALIARHKMTPRRFCILPAATGPVIWLLYWMKKRSPQRAPCCIALRRLRLLAMPPPPLWAMLMSRSMGYCYIRNAQP